MAKSYNFQRLAAIAAILSGLLAWGSLVVGLSGVGYDFEVFSDANLLIQAGAEAATLVRWSLLMNLFGNYLLLTPLALFLWYWLRSEDPLYTTLYSVAGLIYILCGALGAGILAAMWPQIMTDHAQADGAQQETLLALFKTVTGIAQDGIQGPVQNVPAAIWFLGIGRLLISKRRAFAIFSIILGVFLLLNGIGAIFEIEMLTLIGLTANVLLAPLWALWIGITLLRGSVAERES